MAHNSFNDIDETLIARLPFADQPCNYIYTTTYDQVGRVYKIDEPTYDKIIKILSGDPEKDLKTGDKVFVLPGHPLTNQRLVEYFKGMDAKLTKSIEKATVIAGCENFYQESSYAISQINLNKLVFRYKEIFVMTENDSSTLDTSFRRLPKSNMLREDFDNGIHCYITPDVHNPIGFDANMDWEKDAYFVTSTGMNILYNILSKKLRVLTADNVASNANSGVKLEDPDIYKNIYQMLDSQDCNNVNLAINLLIHCDLSGNTEYYLWRLAGEFGSTVTNHDRSKNLSYFLNATDWSSLRYMNTEEFIIHASKKNQITDKLLKELLPDVYANTKSNSNIDSYDEFYDIIEQENYSFTIKLKDKWIKHLKPKKDVAKL